MKKAPCQLYDDLNALTQMVHELFNTLNTCRISKSKTI